MRHPKALMSLVYAIESYEDVVRHLNTVLQGMMEDVDNGDDPGINRKRSARIAGGTKLGGHGGKVCQRV